MISAVFSSVKPMPAAAQPEYELSMEMTTGMSAPPIGMMMSTPSRNDMAAITQKPMCCCVSKNQTISAIKPKRQRDVDDVAAPAG